MSDAIEKAVARLRLYDELLGEMGYGENNPRRVVIRSEIAALQHAGQGEAEPSGYRVNMKNGVPIGAFITLADAQGAAVYNRLGTYQYDIVPLYTTPQPAVPEGWKVEYPESGYGEIVITAPDGTMDIIHENTDFIVEQLCRHLLSAAKEKTE